MLADILIYSSNKLFILRGRKDGKQRQSSFY